MEDVHPITTVPTLIDGFGRQITYLRLSVTDRCDFRCVYCMAENMTFLPKSQILSLDELYQVSAAFVALGVNKIRLTGGEPLVRANLPSLVERLVNLNELKELTLTTNGTRLQQFAVPLKTAGLDRINISLDSLNPKRFHELTRTGHLHNVLDGIRAAQDAGFERIKLNSVILRGRNDDEILNLVHFARHEQLNLTFIEEMPLGQIDEHDRAKAYISSDEILEVIQQEFLLTPTLENTGGPARYYKIPNSMTRIGIISPHSHNFCSSCNRVRLTAEGRLILCLGNEHSADLRSVMRTHPNNQNYLQTAILAAIPIKPETHHFNLNESPQIVRFMNMTGG
ncbi:GTP 3',8-cyclase MoaA [Acinetobacter calcoaceticus]|uniref:GTP 3',8-cyclase MoaA n=1 Tax=Acinetobacter calcoaceticus TaxID=471 RepID=UPI0022745329|nr:GTP 3',8-cyclase MoaA [Acinetobacter calcoaceticus]GLG83644.1 cyclic pyranopterin monophosphate synthase [Acinetobacter calcoaceticus]